MPRPERLGPYRIDEPLGKGGMGTVYAAIHQESGERVAIKALSPELAVAEGFRERFEAEIESLRMLQHDSIVALYGYGEDEGTLFYSMEIVDGASLEEELRDGRRFTWREATRIGIQVCRALKHAHDHGVVHRDIKPANILLDRQEQVKLADFGIARLFGSTQLTVAGGVLGTADFMSPEQADGRPVTDRCDQYSLGCVLYALLAGRPPFRAKTLPEMLQLQRYAEPEPVRRYAPQTPASLERTIAQLLAKSPEDRFPNALVLARHLEAMSHALSKPGRDDFHVNDDSSNDPAGDIRQDDEMALTQVDGGYEDLPSVSLPGATPPTAVVRDQVTRLAPGSDVDQADPAEGDDQPKRPSFTIVGADDRAGASSGLWSTLGLAALLVVLVAGAAGIGYRLLRPLTADELYTSIQALPESAWLEGDATATSQLNAFLQRFPNDPRVDGLQSRRDQLSSSELERRLRGKSLLSERSDDRLSPAEQLYVAALRSERLDKVDAARQYEQLIALLIATSNDEANDDGNAQLAALARQQLARLQQQLAAEAEQHEPFALERLAAAREMADTAPKDAAEVCRALIATYGDRPWAEAIVVDAQKLLDSLML